jgi:hypothetical protein
MMHLAANTAVNLSMDVIFCADPRLTGDLDRKHPAHGWLQPEAGCDGGSMMAETSSSQVISLHHSQISNRNVARVLNSARATASICAA